ncbi:MAG: hypothetical protein IKS78_01605 [Clostridia bacterium]|nr:hypothetical protein [Clostridia bacterium]
MATLIFFAVMLYISALASVYEEDLLISAYVDVSGGVVSKLIPGHLPFLRGKNPPENRKRFTVIGIVLYSVSALCIVFCVYTALTLEPVEGLEYGGGYSRRFMRIGEKYNSTEYLVFDIAFCWMLFEAAIYLINSIGVMLSRPVVNRSRLSLVTTRVITGVLVLLLILFCLAVGKLCWQNAGRTWQDIKNAMAKQ